MTGRWSARCWDCSHTWAYLLNKPPMTDWAQRTIVPLQLLITGYVPLGTCHRSDPCKLKLRRWISKWVSSQETEQPNPELLPSLGRGGKAWGDSTVSKTLVKRELLSYPCWKTPRKPSKTSFWGSKSQLKYLSIMLYYLQQHQRVSHATYAIGIVNKNTTAGMSVTASTGRFGNTLIIEWALLILWYLRGGQKHSIPLLSWPVGFPSLINSGFVESAEVRCEERCRIDFLL